MSQERPPSLALLLYYAFLFLITAISYGHPYPVFGLLLTGTLARAAILVDCLILVHIVVGLWKAQRLTWYLMIGYNGFELASLAVTLTTLGSSEIELLTQGSVSARAFYTGAILAAGGMAAATLYAIKLREAFSNRSPFLF